MSGTAYGTAVLHVSPESAIGGNLAFGPERRYDRIGCRSAEIASGRIGGRTGEKDERSWVRPAPAAERGYVSLYIKHVMGADKGADLDFLVGSSGSIVTRDSH